MPFFYIIIHLCRSDIRPFTMNLRRIIAFFSTASPWRRDVKQDSLLLNLPLCLISDIFDELDWPDKVVFSQTCRGLWYPLHSKCISTFRKATSEDRLKYLTMLSNVLLDHYVCERCCVLHLINPEDVPGIWRSLCWGTYHVPCPLPELNESRLCFCRNYSFGYRHGQLAFKYSRLGGKAVHQRYLNNIMRGFVRKENPSFQERVQSDAFTARPRIIRGKLIVRVRYHFFEDLPKVSYSNIVMTPMSFCPHHRMGGLHYWKNPVILIIYSLFQQPSGTPYPGFHRRKFSCDRCPSDYEFIMKDCMLTVSIWRDLGKGTYLEDPCWRSQIDANDDYRLRSNKFLYEHGSIESMFNSAGTL